MGASFLAPKSSHRCKKQPLLGQLGNTNQNQNETYASKKNLQDAATRSFISYCFISFYISQSADIIFHKFLELHSFNIIWKKIFFSTNSLKPLHLFNGQNSRGMMLDESFLSMIPYYLWWPNFIQMLLMVYHVF